MAQMIAIRAEQLRQRCADMPAFARGPQRVGDQRPCASGHRCLQTRTDGVARCQAFERQQQHQHAGQKRDADTVIHLRQQAETQAKQRQQRQPDAGAIHRKMCE